METKKTFRSVTYNKLLTTYEQSTFYGFICGFNKVGISFIGGFIIFNFEISAKIIQYLYYNYGRNIFFMKILLILVFGIDYEYLIEKIKKDSKNKKNDGFSSGFVTKKITPSKIHGVFIKDLIEFLVNNNKFSRNIIRKHFGISVKEHTELSRDLELVGILVRGENNVVLPYSGLDESELEVQLKNLQFLIDIHINLSNIENNKFEDVSKYDYNNHILQKEKKWDDNIIN